MNATHLIRRANRSDARQLALLAESTFRDTFAATNTVEDLDLHCRANYSETVQAAEISSASAVTLLAERDGAVVGFAQMRWGEELPDCVQAKSPGEIHRLYVRVGWHGKGVAQDLMNACIDEMRVRGSDVVWLGVWERNPRAMSFYRKFDFVEVGDHVFHVGSDPQRDLIMVRSSIL